MDAISASDQHTHEWETKLYGEIYPKENEAMPTTETTAYPFKEKLKNLETFSKVEDEFNPSIWEETLTHIKKRMQNNYSIAYPQIRVLIQYIDAIEASNRRLRAISSIKAEVQFFAEYRELQKRFERFLSETLTGG